MNCFSDFVGVDEFEKRKCVGAFSWTFINFLMLPDWCFYTRRFSNRLCTKGHSDSKIDCGGENLKVVSPQVAVDLHTVRVKQEDRLPSRFRIPCFDWLQTYCVTQIEPMNWSLHSWKHVELWSVCFATSVSDCTLMSFCPLYIFFPWPFFFSS